MDTMSEYTLEYSPRSGVAMFINFLEGIFNSFSIRQLINIKRRLCQGNEDA